MGLQFSAPLMDEFIVSTLLTEPLYGDSKHHHVVAS
jgi:hypothetical protein